MSISIDFSEAAAGIRTIIARLDDLVPFYDAMGHYAVRQAEERIMSTKTSPEGQPWAPWHPYTETLRTLKGNTGQGINWDSGDLLKSLSFDVDGNFEVLIGSDLDYAVDVQNGDDKGREARPILGWTDEDHAVALRCAMMYIETGYAGVLS